jgi:2-polyprenyl-3-methyl-5-hydroxy-6-metoxy-1,4-benzoquinol methylase
MDLDKYASQYAQLEEEWGLVYRMNIDYRVSTMQPYFRPGAALELGTGGGHCTAKLAKHFTTMDSVEGSADLADRLRTRGLPANVDLHVSYFESFEPPRKYDDIFMIQILEHVENPVAVLAKYRNALNDGGRVFITVPNAQSIHRLAAVEMGLLQSAETLNEIDLNAGHRRVYTPASMASDLHRAGFRLVFRGGLFVKPLSNTQIATQWTESMIRAFHEIAPYLPDHAAEVVAIAEARS